MFSQRELSILIHLKNCQSVVSPAFLAKRLRVSQKTIQNDIQHINKSLSDSEKILCTAAGYHLPCMETPTLTSIYHQLQQEKPIKDEISYRNIILTYLAFQHDYISMEQLGEALYLSKSTIFNKFDGIRRLRLLIKVSPSQGLRLNGLESFQRYMVANTCTQDISVLKFIHKEAQFEAYRQQLQKPLVELFIRHNYYVSGDSMRQFLYYLIITLIRIQDDFPLELPQQKIALSSLMTDISDLIESLFSMQLCQDELMVIQRCLNELNALPIHFSYDKLDRTFWIYQKFCQDIYKDLQISIHFDKKTEDRFLCHLHKFYQRSRNNHRLVNNLKREINRRFPLSVQVVVHYLLPLLDVQIQESEVSLIALYLAEFIENRREPLRLLLLSNSDPCILNFIEQRVETLLASEELAITSTPLYLYNQTAESYDIILTTEEALPFQNSDVIYISKLPDRNELLHIKEEILQVIENRKQAMIASMFNLDTYIRSGNYTHISERYDSISSLFAAFGLTYDPNPYEMLLDEDALLCNQFLYDDQTSSFQVYVLEHGISYKNKNIRVLVMASYNIQDKAALPFYYFIRKVLTLDNIKATIKSIQNAQ